MKIIVSENVSVIEQKIKKLKAAKFRAQLAEAGYRGVVRGTKINLVILGTAITVALIAKALKK